MRPLEVDADDRRDPEHAEPKADSAREARALRAGRGRDDHRDERDRGDQESRERARDLRLGRPEQHPREGDLDGGEREDRCPVREERTELSAGGRDRQEQQRRDGGAAQHEHRRAHVVDRDLDQEVGNPPDHAHRDKEQGATSGHRTARRPARVHRATLRIRIRLGRAETRTSVGFA